MNRVVLWIAAAAILLYVAAPAVSQASGCKSCTGSVKYVFVRGHSTQHVLLNELGYAVVMQAPMGGKSYEHWCMCEDFDYCSYEIREMPPGVYPPGSNVPKHDTIHPFCMWVPDEQDFWCTDVSCNIDDPGDPILLVPMP